MHFVKSEEMKIEVSEKQKKQLSSKENIVEVLKQDDVIGFDIYDDDHLIGFAMLRKFSEYGYFLWDYAIDYRWQNKHLGTRALKELIEYLKDQFNIQELTTTYTWGNEHAKHIYEKVGFVETDIVDEDDCHEVNMIYRVE